MDEGGADNTPGFMLGPQSHILGVKKHKID